MKWEEIDQTSHFLGLTEQALGRVLVVRDELDSMNLHDLAKLQAEVGRLEDRLAAAKTECTKLYDRIRLGSVPGKMDETGTSSITIEGVGRVTLVSDLHASLKSGKQEDAYLWLRDRGHGDLIKPTINSSTLKAFCKRMIQGGEELPEEFFNVSPFTRAQITKV